MTCYFCINCANCAFFTCLATAPTRESNVSYSLKDVPTATRRCLPVVKLSKFTILEHTSSVQITIVRTNYRQPHVPTFHDDVTKQIQACFAAIRQWLPLVNVGHLLRAVLKKTVLSNSSPIHLVAPQFLCYAVKLLKSEVPYTKDQQYCMAENSKHSRGLL